MVGSESLLRVIVNRGALWEELQGAPAPHGGGGRRALQQQWEDLCGSLASMRRCELAWKALREEGKKCQL